MTVSGTVTDIGAVDRSGFEYRLISGTEVLWQSKDVDPPALSFTVTIEDLQAGSNYAVRAFYTVGLVIYYSNVQNFSTPEAPATPTAAPTTTPTPTLTPAPTTQTVQTTTSQVTTKPTTLQTTTQSQSAPTTTTPNSDNPARFESTDFFLLIILGIIALALISIAVALYITIAKKSKQ